MFGGASVHVNGDTVSNDKLDRANLFLRKRITAQSKPMVRACLGCRLRQGASEGKYFGGNNIRVGPKSENVKAWIVSEYEENVSSGIQRNRANKVSSLA
jgi:hypothetical protein